MRIKAVNKEFLSFHKQGLFLKQALGEFEIIPSFSLRYSFKNFHNASKVYSNRWMVASLIIIENGSFKISSSVFRALKAS